RGHDQVAVDQFQPDVRVAPCRHDQQLIDIGDDDLLQVAGIDIGPGQQGATWQHTLNHAAAYAIFADGDMIADRCGIGEASFRRVEIPAQAAQHRAVFDLHAEQALAHFDYAPGQNTGVMGDF